MSIETETENALRTILETAAQTKDFVLEQAPDVIHQLLLFTSVKSIIYISIVMLVWFIVYKFVSYEPESNKGDHEGGCIFLTIFSTVFGLPVFVYHCLVLAKVLLAPKLFILEYAAKLVS